MTKVQSRAGLAGMIEAAAQLACSAVAEITGPSRERSIAMARFLVVNEARRRGYSLDAIGLALGGRDHTTISHAARGIPRALAYFNLPAGFRLASDKEGCDMARPSKYSAATIAAVRADWAAGVQQQIISARHGVPIGSLHGLAAGVTRVHFRHQPVEGTISALSADQRNDLLRRYELGEPLRALAAAFGVFEPQNISDFGRRNGLVHGSKAVAPVVVPKLPPRAPLRKGLTEEQVEAIRAAYAAGDRVADIGAAYAILPSRVWSICEGITRPRPPRIVVGALSSMSDTRQADLLRRYAEGVDVAALAAEYGVTAAAVRAFANYRDVLRPVVTKPASKRAAYAARAVAAEAAPPAVRLAAPKLAHAAPPAAPKSALVLDLERSGGRYAALEAIAAEYRLTRVKVQQLWHRVRAGQGGVAA